MVVSNVWCSSYTLPLLRVFSDTWDIWNVFVISPSIPHWLFNPFPMGISFLLTLHLLYYCVFTSFTLHHFSSLQQLTQILHLSVIASMHKQIGGERLHTAAQSPVWRNASTTWPSMCASVIALVAFAYAFAFVTESNTCRDLLSNVTSGYTL